LTNQFSNCRIRGHVTAALDVSRARLSPLRRRVLEGLADPESAAGLAVRLGESRQRVNYHVRELEKAGLVELVEERRRRGCIERVVRATARAVVVAPEVIGDLDTVAETQDRFATEMLLAIATRAVQDVAAMRAKAGAQGRRLVTFAVEADVAFDRPADIERFADALAERITELAAEFDSGNDGRRYRVLVGGYPKPATKEDA
jgi:DNA-binding transcriptional ArsR family regulator